MNARTGRFQHAGTELGWVAYQGHVAVFLAAGGEHFARIPLCGMNGADVDDETVERLHAAWRAGYDAGVPEGRAEKVREIRKALGI